jgi:hypothetical protein
MSSAHKFDKLVWWKVFIFVLRILINLVVVYIN